MSFLFFGILYLQKMAAWERSRQLHWCSLQIATGERKKFSQEKLLLNEDSLFLFCCFLYLMQYFGVEIFQNAQ